MAEEDELHLGNPLSYLRHAMSLARKSPPKPTNYRVGALLVNELNGEILSSGFTLEQPGNTHAEQVALAKYALLRSVDNEMEVGKAMPKGTVLYTTMEPCSTRLSGQTPCVDRILKTRDSASEEGGGISKVYYGVKEPEDFVQNEGFQKLKAAGIECIYIEGLEEEILEIAKAGHQQSG